MNEVTLHQARLVIGCVTVFGGYTISVCNQPTTCRSIQPCVPHTHTHTDTPPLNGPLSRTTRVSRYQKGKAWAGISWAICTSAPSSRQITTPAPHHSVFYRSDALLAAQPTASKHWRQPSKHWRQLNKKNKRTLNSSWTKKANHQSIIHVAWKQPVCLLKSK